MRNRPEIPMSFQPAPKVCSSAPPSVRGESVPQRAKPSPTPFPPAFGFGRLSANKVEKGRLLILGSRADCAVRAVWLHNFPKEGAKQVSTVLSGTPTVVHPTLAEPPQKPQYPGIPTTSDGAGIVVWVETHITQGACAYPITSSTTMGGGYQVE